MSRTSLNESLNISINPEHEYQQKANPIVQKKKIKLRTQNKQSSQIKEIDRNSPTKKVELKKVQDEIEVMKNKIQLLKQQLNKEQQVIKMNKNKTEQIIRKKINVNKIQKYKQKDVSLDIQRAQRLRIRNASFRQSHQQEMQNIFKAIYLVKLDDARQIKNLSKNYQQKIKQSNDQIWNQQIQRKKKIAEQSQRAKQKYQRYFKQKIASIYEDQTKNKQEMQRVVSQKKDQLKQLRQLEIKLLQDMNKAQVKQIQSKKQYIAALSLPVKDVAEALNRSKSSMQTSPPKLNDVNLQRMSSQYTNEKKSINLTNNLSQSSVFNDSLLKDQFLSQKSKIKIPNSTVNKDKLKVILKQLKRLQKSQKQPMQKSKSIEKTN